MADKLSCSILSRNTCRCCGNENKLNGVDLCGVDKERINSLLKILSLLPLEVINFQMSDDLPKYICANCELILNNFFEFCEMVKKTQTSMILLTTKENDQDICNDSKTKACHNFDIEGNKSAVTINFGENGIVKCASCGYNLIPEEFISLDVASNGLDTVMCVCLKCEHRGNISSFMHNKSNAIRCPKCRFVFYKRPKYARQKKKLKKVHECNVCFKQFASKSRCERHKLVHSEVKQFLCDTCGAGFSQKVSLTMHMMSHSGSNPYQCQLCKQSFRFKLSLKSHELNVHPETLKNDKKNQCDHCNKRFASKYKLNRHIRGHTGERPFKCEHCGRRFSQNFNLKKHLKTHTVETPCTTNLESNDQLENTSLKTLEAIFENNCENPEEIIILKAVNENTHNSDTFCDMHSAADLFSNFSPQEFVFESEPQMLPTFEAVYRLT